MSSHSNKAIYLDSKGNHSIRAIDEPYAPLGSQSLVQVRYSAVNPADKRHFYMGMSEFVAGYEFEGTVIEIGPESPFRVGQDVFGFSIPGDHRPLHVGAHQDFLLAEAFLTFERPKDLDPITAVTLLAGALTAIDALFNVLGFGFPLAGLDGKNPSNVPILIWGGSSVIGQAAIKLAKKAGMYPILTTASPSNHDALREMGATKCFNYRSSTVVDEIRTAAKSYGGKLTHVFDTVATGMGIFEGLSKDEQRAVDEKYALSSPALARQSCDPNTPENELQLCAALPVGREPWKFCFMIRTVETMHYEVGDVVWSEEQRRSEEARVRKWGSRNDAAIRWLIAHHATQWQPPRTRLVTGAAEGVQAIQDVFYGKTSREKIVITRPL